MKIFLDNLQEDISNDLTVKEISIKYGVSESTIRRRLSYFNLTRKYTTKLKIEEQKLLIKYYKEGIRRENLSKIFKCSMPTIYEILRKNNIEIGKQGRYKKGKKYPNTGLKRYGDLNPNWKNGITELANSIRSSERYSHWRFSVFERDNFRCKICNKYSIPLEAHHLIRFRHIIKNNSITSLAKAIKCEELWYVDNGLTVCYKCHKKIHEKEGK